MKNFVLCVTLLAAFSSSCAAEELWFYPLKKMQGNFFFFPERKAVVLQSSTEAYRGKSVMEIHYPEDLQCGTVIWREPVNLRENFNSAQLKFAYKSVEGFSIFGVSLASGLQGQEEHIVTRRRSIIAVNEWREISIPLTDFLPGRAFEFAVVNGKSVEVTPDLNPSCVRDVRFSNLLWNPCELYIANVRIETP